MTARLPKLRAWANSNCSGLAIGYQLPELHDLSVKTIFLRAGLRLGFIRSN